MKEMKLNFCLSASLLSIGLLLSAPDAAKAQLAGVDTSSFQKIEQPIETRAAITIAGLGLVGLELWWFLISKANAERRKAVIQLNPDATEPPMYKDSAAMTPATTLSAEAQRYCEQIISGLSSIYNDIQMPEGVILVEDRIRPQFSVG